MVRAHALRTASTTPRVRRQRLDSARGILFIDLVLGFAP